MQCIVLLIDVGIGSRLLAGCTTGAMAVAVAQPTDVVKVRFQAQIGSGANKRYHGTMDAYRTIAKQEGFRGLWKGERSHKAIFNSVYFDFSSKLFLLHLKELDQTLPEMLL